jgi:DNA-binding transcriptional regulator of glucitol operon
MGEQNRRNMIIAIVVLVVLCCCCASLALGWQFGDQLLDALSV